MSVVVRNSMISCRVEHHDAIEFRLVCQATLALSMRLPRVHEGLPRCHQSGVGELILSAQGCIVPYLGLTLSTVGQKLRFQQINFGFNTMAAIPKPLALVGALRYVYILPSGH